MSLPSELRILCQRLASTPSKDLPSLTPSLVQYVLQCQIPLSNPSVNSGKADASQSAVLVHKLKTQLTTLLNGKSAEGRFAAIVLIKVVVEVGGWEILRDAASWVRGLLSALGKPNSSAAKEMCIVSLTKIYCMTHQYQTLVREITTPTLPTFVTSCLNLISSKPSTNVPDVSPLLVETVFRSFSMLLPRHTTIFRPFASQLRAATRPYLACTLCDQTYVPLSVKESARKLVVVLHQTVAKNGGGEEWGKAVRDLVQSIHMTADQVFRAVVEDWESTAGYIAEPVNVDEELSGGARSSEDLSRWTGIDAGIERLVGLLELLEEYLTGSTPSSVTIPVGSIFDVITRILSIPLPSPADSNSGSVRLHPAIDRDERDGLWTGLPKVFVSVLHLISTMSATLEQGFVSLAQGSLDLLMWSFSSGRNHQEFRASTYSLVCKILPLVSQSLDKSCVSKLVPIMRACCKDLETSYSGISSEPNKSQPKGASSQNADTLLQGSISTIVVVDPNVVAAATSLLPVLLSGLPQGNLDISMRSQIERTAILGRNKDAMLASILNPFVGKNGKALSSILPHITRAFPNDDTVEILLRPRMPIIPAGYNTTALNDLTEDVDVDVEDEIMDSIDEVALQNQRVDASAVENFPHSISEKKVQSSLEDESRARLGGHDGFPTINSHAGFEAAAPLPTLNQGFTESQPLGQRTMNTDTVMTYEDADGSDSDSDGSVHLTMQLDSDSE